MAGARVSRHFAAHDPIADPEPVPASGMTTEMPSRFLSSFTNADIQVASSAAGDIHVGEMFTSPSLSPRWTSLKRLPVRPAYDLALLDFRFADPAPSWVKAAASGLVPPG